MKTTSKGPVRLLTFSLSRAVLKRGLCFIVTVGIFSAAAAAALLTPRPASASPLGFESDSFYAYLEGSYYLTKQDFMSGGAPLSLINNSQLSYLRMDLTAAYDFNDSFEMYSKMGFQRSDSVDNDPFLGTIEKTNSNITDVAIGTNCLLLSGVVNLIPDILDFPLYPTPVGIDNNVLLGDGAIVLAGKLYLAKKIRSILISAFSGAEFRTQGLSTLIPWGIMGHGDIKSFFVELSLDGAFSLNNDQDTYNPLLRTAVTSTLDAGSFLFDAVNPSWFNGGATFGWRFAPGFFATAGIEQSIWGVNTAMGTKFLLGLGFTTASASRGDSFKVDTEKEDQTDTGDESDVHGQGKITGPAH